MSFRTKDTRFGMLSLLIGTLLWVFCNFCEPFSSSVQALKSCDVLALKKNRYKVAILSLHSLSQDTKEASATVTFY